MCIGKNITHSLQASTAAGPVAVVEVEAFALQDEGSYAILYITLATSHSGMRLEKTYLGLCHRFERCERHFEVLLCYSDTALHNSYRGLFRGEPGST